MGKTLLFRTVSLMALANSARFYWRPEPIIPGDVALTPASLGLTPKETSQ